jgi:hypothetical protein
VKDAKTCSITEALINAYEVHANIRIYANKNIASSAAPKFDFFFGLSNNEDHEEDRFASRYGRPFVEFYQCRDAKSKSLPSVSAVPEMPERLLH